MDYKTANEKIKSLKTGCFYKFQFVTEVPVLKSSGPHTVHKRTSGCFRVGVNWANTAQGKLSMKARGVTSPGPLPWGSYKEGTGNRIIEYTNKKGEYNEYIRLFFTPNKVKTELYLDGEPTTASELLSKNIISSHSIKANESGSITVNLKNLERIG